MLTSAFNVHNSFPVRLLLIEGVSCLFHSAFLFPIWDILSSGKMQIKLG